MVHSRLLLLSALLFFWASAAQGQGFRKIYGINNAQFRDVVETADGSFFLAGTSGQQPALFQLTDRVGNPIWSYTMNLGGAKPMAACQVADGGFAVLAEYFNDGTGYRNLVIKVSPAGTVQWQTPVLNDNMENGGADLVAMPDGGVVVLSSVRTDFFNQNAKLLKINADGSPGWSSEFGLPNADEFAVRLLADADGGFTVGGFGTYGAAGQGIADLFLAKTDASGTLLWQKNYPKPATQFARDLLRATDGGIVLLGETQQADPNQAVVLKTDAAGNELWFTAFHPSPRGPEASPLLVFNALAQDNAGQLHVPILLYDFNSISAGVDSSFLVRLSPGGQLVAQKGFHLEDDTRQIIHTQDDKLVLAGSTGMKNWPTTSAYLSKLNLEGELYGNFIRGTLYHDLNDDCLQQPSEPVLPNFSVRAENAAGEVFFTQTDPTGGYSLVVSEGTFDLTAEPLFGLTENWGACDTPAVTVAGLNVTANAPTIGIRSLSTCPQMDVELSAGILRRCFTARFIVNYCNAGAADASESYVVLTADPNLEFLSSSLPLTSQVGQEFRFDLGNAVPGECGSFNADFKVGCNTPLGAVICMDAHIFPDTFCPPPSTADWDGSYLVADGACDGEVKFILKNVGHNDMSEAVEYVIIEDQIIFMQSMVQLDADEDTTITVIGTPNGKSYYLGTEQAKGYPGKSRPSATVQGCGGNGGENLLLQMPQDQGDYMATYCAEVRGSFDPNDKQGFPMGWQEQHLIEKNQALDYLIRFQNTGNDTAFLVVLRDTLSPLLAAGTVRPGPSSHPYQFDLSGDGVLTFRFPNILLPDSNVNEVASHGYVRFRVEQQPDLPLGSRIENRAAIYFDFNEAVITNTTFHTIGERLLSFTVDRPADLVGLSIVPNPMSDEAIFRLQTPITGADLRLALFDATGRIVRDEMFAQPEYRFQRRGLLPGMYFFAVKKDGAVVASGRVVVR